MMNYDEIDEFISDLKKIKSQRQLFLICKAIAPESVAPLYSKDFLIEIIKDVLQSRGEIKTPI